MEWSSLEAATHATSPSRLSNISTRGLVRTEDDVMIGGFIIEGSSIQPLDKSMAYQWVSA